VKMSAAERRPSTRTSDDDERGDDVDESENRARQWEEMMLLVSIFGERARGEDAEAVREALETGESTARDESERALWCELELHVEVPERGVRVRSTVDVADESSASMALVKTMPSIFLAFTFPRAYPSAAAPNFVLRADWLSNSHLSALAARLDAMWVENFARDPIVYEWTEWLRSSAMEDVLLNSVGVLDLSARALGWFGETFELDPRGVVTAKSASEAEFSILRAEAVARRREYLVRADHTCGVCLSDDVRGVDMRRISASCSHTFCVDCVSRMALVHVREGSVTSLLCPSQECSCPFEPHVLREVLSNDEFEKYEALLLSKTLDAMSDLVYCPRCEWPVIEDEEARLGRCVKCLYAFCTLCRAAWHAGEQCLNAEQKLAVLEARKRGDSQMSDDALRKYREEIADASAAAYVARNGKTCPSCRQAIEKNEGCNKMTCSCGAYFCWTCGKRLLGDGYSHYRNVNGEPGTSACQLFDLDAVAAWENEMAALNLQRQGRGNAQRERAADIAVCVRCKAANVMFDRNNHVRCWACNSSFCAACRNLVAKTSEHYGPGKPCRQHGT